MKSFIIKNWKKVLKEAITDAQIGIKIACFIDNDKFSTYVTEIPIKSRVIDV